MEKELAVKKIKEYRSCICHVTQLHNDIDYLTKQTAPRNHLTAQFSADDRGCASTMQPDTMKLLASIKLKQQRISELEACLKRIERSLALLPEEERLTLIMKYVDCWQISSMADYFGYASRQSVYSLLKRSVTNFSHFMDADA